MGRSRESKETDRKETKGEMMDGEKRSRISTKLYDLAKWVLTGDVIEFSVKCSIEDDDLVGSIRHGEGQGFMKILERKKKET